MRHKLRGRKLNRTSSHRKAMFTNMLISLFRHQRIVTTVPKAKDLRPIAEKLITLAKKGDSLHNRRLLLSALRNDAEIVSKLFDEFATRYKSYNGGYCRIVKAGYRFGDNAPIAVIELLDNSLA